jgi:hypothetical protein
MSGIIGDILLDLISVSIEIPLGFLAKCRRKKLEGPADNQLSCLQIRKTDEPAPERPSGQFQ